MKNSLFRPLWSTATAATIGLVVTLTAQAATCPGNLGPSTTPTAAFTDNGNGTITHATTGLIWKKCNEGLSGATCAVGSPDYLFWNDALIAAKASAFAGYSDWRLPNKQELESLVDDTCYAPPMNDTVFPNAWQDLTWTSSWSTFGGAVWAVDFSSITGSVLPSIDNSVGVVRLVRGGQSFDALTADVTPPSTVIGAAPVSGSSTSVTLSFTGNDDVAVTGYECSLDGATFGTCVSPVTYSGLSVGEHSFRVRAKDAAGNADASPASVTWNVLAATSDSPVPVPVGGSPWLAFGLAVIAYATRRQRHLMH